MDSNTNWKPSDLLRNKIDNFFFETRWDCWFLVEFLEFRKNDILAGLSRVKAHQTYKRGLQLILESNPPEIIALTIMKQLTQKINESNEIKSFWKLVAIEKTHTEQLNKLRTGASFEKDVLNIRGKRFNEEVDDLTQRVIKRTNLDKFDANLSEDEPPSTPTPAPRVNNIQGVGLGEMMQAEFWTQKSDYDQNANLTTPHKPILTQNQFNLLTSRVIPGFKSLKSLPVLGPTLTKWLREVLSSPTPEKLYEQLMQPLEGGHVTDRDNKLYDIFKTTLQEFYIMIKYNPNHILPRHNCERKFLVDRVSTPFKLIEYVFGNCTTYWIEKEVMSTKAMEFVDEG
ncbi:hypothetical protein Glove_801g14 [Diversispora epigaea]|uniref:Uncharacterized protein n=1 Tax=Diversispora epigaea TaxID=1348612 RepID=A0A397G747_9GLOM|nr:hypothetical protein Glove_801g14 [Diversispora epigaea]